MWVLRGFRCWLINSDLCEELITHLKAMRKHLKEQRPFLSFLLCTRAVTFSALLVLSLTTARFSICFLQLDLIDRQFHRKGNC